MLCPIGTVDDPHLNFFRKRLYLRTSHNPTYIYKSIKKAINVNDFIVTQ